MTPRPTEPLLVVENLTVRYGDLVALRGVSIELGTNETIAILGVNGAGKSTLLNCIAGLVPVGRGDVAYSGTSLRHVAAHERVGRGLALVPEGRLLFAPLSVEQNLRLGMLCAGWRAPTALLRERLEEVLELFPALRDKLRQAAGDLSGGQQQMVAIGRALMSNPQLLILDEPSLGLAPRIVEDVFDVLRKLRQTRGLSVLLAEQNTDQALDIADRAYVLELGRVALTDDARAIAARADLAALYLGRSGDFGEVGAA